MPVPPMAVCQPGPDWPKRSSAPSLTSVSNESNTAPTASDLIGVPTPLAIIFAARCARRVEHLFAVNWTEAPDFRIKALDQAIAAAEDYSAAEREQRFSLQTQAEFVANMAETAAEQARSLSAESPEAAAERARTANAAAQAAALAAKTATARDLAMTAELAAQCASMSLAAAPTLGPTIQRDLAWLKRLAQREKWSNQSAIDQSYFWLHMEFDTARKLGDSSITDICSAINARLTDFYSRNPEKLYSLTMSGFLEVLSEQLKPCAFEIEFHTRTRDGSHDLAGVVNTGADARYLLECKAYAEEKRIDVRPVMTLNGRTLDTEFIKGLIATSARQSEMENATGTFERNQYLLPTEEFAKLMDWLSACQRHALRSSASATATT